MKQIIKHIVLFTAISFVCCSTFDDAELRNRIDSAKNRIEGLQAKAAEIDRQLRDLSLLTNGNVITSVSRNSDGRYVLTYKDDTDAEHAVVITTTDDLLDVPILGVKLDEAEGVYYWTLYTDGTVDWLRRENTEERIPVRGNMPVLSVDEAGYWIVDGKRICTSDGTPIAANDAESAVFRAASYENGIFTLTLGNGETLMLPVFDTLNLKLESTATVTVLDASAGCEIAYEVTGTAAEQSIVAIASATGGVVADIDREKQKISVQFDSSFAEDSDAHLIVVAYDGGDHTVIKPVFFRPASSGRIDIASAADMLRFASEVNGGQMPAGMQVYLTQDIDLNSEEAWTPIGQATITPGNFAPVEIEGHPFSGQFDGGGHKIKNLHLALKEAGDDAVYGLFGVLKDAEVRNLIIGDEKDDASALSVETAASVWAGVVAGAVIDSKVADITSYAAIRYDSGTAPSSRIAVGMVALCTSDGSASKLENLKNYGSLTVDVHGCTNNGFANAPHVGGICAIATSNTGNKQVNRIDYCANYGDIVSNAARTAGIVAAANNYTEFNSCVNYGNQTNSIGGTGRLGNITCLMGTGCAMTECTNYGDLISTSDDGARCGGLISLPNHASNAFTSCSNYGKVITNSSYRGVFFGYNAVASNWVNCLAAGIKGVYNNGTYVYDAFEEAKKESYLGPMGAKEGQQANLSNITYQIGSTEGDGPTEGPEPELRILCIGNSFTKDAVEHLPKLIAGAGINTVKIVHLYYGGRTIPEYTNGYSTASDYTCYVFNTGSDLWLSYANRTIEEMVKSDKWDIVTIQEHTGNYRAWSWTAEEKNAITGLIDKIKADQGDNVPKFKYILSQAYFNMDKIATASKPYMTWSTQQEMFAVIAAQARQVLAETEIDAVIPTGTTLQNLRTTPLNNAMDLTRDGYHMDYGLARYAAACTVFDMLIAPSYPQAAPLEANPFRYTVSSTAENGWSTPVTDDNYQVAISAARKAIEKPFEITDLSASVPAPSAFPSKWVFSDTNAAAMKNEWTTSHTLSATSGSLAKITAVRGEGNSDTPLDFTVYNNKPTVSTMVDGDYWLYTVPASNLEAGTAIEFDATIGGGSGAPKYFIVEYLEDGEWKSVAEDLHTAPDAPSVRYTYKSSGDIDNSTYQHATVMQTFRLEKPIENGTLQIRCRAVGDMTASDKPQAIDKTGRSLFPRFGFTACYIQNLGTAKPKDTKRVLCLGNSFSYYNAPVWMLKEIAYSQGHYLRISAHLKGSQTLTQHCDLALSSEAIGYGDYDFALLQEQSQSPAKYGQDPAANASVLQGLQQIVSQIGKRSTSCRMILEETWAFSNSSYGGFSNYDDFDRYNEQGVLALAEETRLSVSPIGAAFREARKNSAINLYHTDSKHQSPEGAYLKACVNYLVLFGEKFTGEIPSCGLNADHAAYLRTVAEQTVLGNEAKYRIQR